MDTNLPAIHLGEFLAEIPTEIAVSQAPFARAINVSPRRVSHVVHGDRPVTAELALLGFGKGARAVGTVLAEPAGRLRSRRGQGRDPVAGSRACTNCRK